MKRFVCKNCGVVNVASSGALANDDDDWLDCVLPEGFEWILPAGKITPIVGEPIYISGLGEHLSRSAYLKKYNIDPEIAYNMMRGNRRYRSASYNYSSVGQSFEAVESESNTSSKAETRSQARSQARSASQAQNSRAQAGLHKKPSDWFDEDDWST